jgi:hypothetical protein
VPFTYYSALAASVLYILVNTGLLLTIQRESIVVLIVIIITHILRRREDIYAADLDRD